jgi:hypothetical protein
MVQGVIFEGDLQFSKWFKKTIRKGALITPRWPPWPACVHFRDLYPINVSHLSINFLRLLLLH